MVWRDAGVGICAVLRLPAGELRADGRGLSERRHTKVETTICCVRVVTFRTSGSAGQAGCRRTPSVNWLILTAWVPRYELDGVQMPMPIGNARHEPPDQRVNR